MSEFQLRPHRLRNIPASRIDPHPDNFRLHTDNQKSKLSAILAEIGFVGTITVRPHGSDDQGERFQCLDGHERLSRFGPDEKVPCLVVKLSDEEAAKFLATFDTITGLADMDVEALERLTAGLEWEHDDLDELIADTLAGTHELIESLLEETPREPPVEVLEDVIPAVPKKPRTKRGDLYLLGDHRLLCGDSSDSRDLVRLNPERNWDIAIIDPPFQLGSAVWLRWIMDPCIVFGTGKNIRLIPDALWRWERVLLKKYRHRTASTQMDNRHAWIVQCGSVKTTPTDQSLTFSSVVEQEANPEHNHAKPVSLLVEHLTHWTPDWRIVIDPFAGGGSTIMAAQQMGRVCHAIELDPGWCDVIVERWKAATGLTPQLEREAPGIAG